MKKIESCPICHHRNFQPFASIEDQGQAVKYVLCRHCGLVFQTPRMEEGELAKFYAGAYRKHQQATEKPIEKDLLMQEARAMRTLALIGKKVSGIDRHLDIGSSSGALLRAFQRQFECAGVGIEPGEAYRTYSREQGDRVFPDQSALLQAGEGRFDLITMMHVLEHMPDPVHDLAGIQERFLSPGGHLLLEVPNLYEHASFELSHLYAFSGSTLREVLRQAGLKVIWLHKHGSFRSPILRLYITVLAMSTGERHPPRRTYVPGAVGVALGRRLGSWKRRLLTARWPDWTWQSPAGALSSSDTPDGGTE